MEEPQEAQRRSERRREARVKWRMGVYSSGEDGGGVRMVEREEVRVRSAEVSAGEAWRRVRAERTAPASWPTTRAGRVASRICGGWTHPWGPPGAPPPWPGSGQG